MNIVKKMSKKKLLETYKNNYEIVSKRKQELYDKNIELQKIVIEQDKLIVQLQKEKKVLKGKLTKTKNELNKYKGVEIAPSVEKGNEIIQKLFTDQKENENEQ